MPGDGWQLIAERRYRIGIQRLWRHWDGRYAVSLDNRTYHQFFEIPADRVARWRKEFGDAE